MWIVTKVTIQTHSRRRATMTLPDNVTLDLDDLAIPASAGQPFAVTNEGTGWTVWCRQEVAEPLPDNPEADRHAESEKLTEKEEKGDDAEGSGSDQDTEPAIKTAEADQADGKKDIADAPAGGSDAKTSRRKPRTR